MKQKFTNNQLLKFLYKETSASESLAIKEAMNDDFGLYEQYAEMEAGFQQLPKVKFNPSKTSIQNILNHSRKTAVSTQH